MRWIALIAVCGCACANLTSADPKPEADFKSVKPTMSFHGTDSSILTTGLHRITTEADWQQHWAKHHTDKAPLQLNQFMTVDFDKFMVIAIHLEGLRRDNTVIIEEIAESTETIRIRHVPFSLQTGDGGDIEAKIPPIEYNAGAYAFVMFPKSNKSITLEYGKRSLLSDPYKWTEKGRLASLNVK